MILFWFLSFQYYKRYGKKTAKNLTFLCKVAPVYGTHLLLWKRIKVIVRHTKRHLWQNGEKLGEKKTPKNKQLSQYWCLFVT
jgi:hypothetical protein